MKWGWILGLVQIVAAQQDYNNETLWGAYRSNLYFGLRPRIPQSVMTGLVWFGTQDYQSIGRARHACDQGDGIDSYTWTEYDPRRGGVQVIKDGPNNVQITTEFIKVPGGDHGGSWAARVKGKPIKDSVPSRTSLIFYLGIEGLGGIDMETDEEENGIEGPEVKFSGSSPELDDFTIRIVDGPNNEAVTSGPHYAEYRERVGKTHFLARPVQPGQLWQAKDVILQNIIQKANEALAPYKDGKTTPPDPSFTLQLPDDLYMGSNLYAVQKFFDGPFQFDVYFDSKSAHTKLDSHALDEGIIELKASFDEKFTTRFSDASAYPSKDPAAIHAFSKAITANLAGGVGYFYGTSIVDKKFSYEWDNEEDTDDEREDVEEGGGAHLTDPKALLTATPSRSFFPRGFYWDEGFHLIQIGLLDNDFSLEILQDWINLIDDNGWVAREQILGEEARSKVPAEFQTQVPNYANPPTLPMALTAFIKRAKAFNPSGPSDAELGMDYGVGQVPLSKGPDIASSGSRHLQNPELAKSYLISLYAPLKRHYEWFRRTQRGQIKQYSRKARSRTEAYRWRGRSETHVLTSGMDDYPRGPPHPGELHVDLISWMAFFSRTMKEIAEFIGETDDAASFAEIENSIIENIDDLHWSKEEEMYCDANVDDEDESYHVCHKGYLSLFPLMLGLLPADSPNLGPVLDLLYDPEELWSPYGIRSLSASHPEFGQGENYWKGPIWIQMNYLVLQALHNRYAREAGPHKQKAQEIYQQLRKNIIDNTFKEYERSGYVWEQYDSKTGQGQRSHPFTGWTSLVSLIIAEKY